MSFSPFLLLYHLSLFAVHFFSIAPAGKKAMEKTHNVIRTDTDFQEKYDVVNVAVYSNAECTISRVEIMWHGAVQIILRTKNPAP